MANSRLAQILEQEYKTRGIVGGAVSAFGKRTKEKLDIRNALFSGGGLGSIVGTKIFGKGYSATRKTGSSSSSSTTPSLDGISNATLEDINTNTKITAKNTLSIPMMARDMNIVKLNIVRMVKLLGGQANRNKTDMFWADSKKREDEYERQFGRKPSQVSSDGTAKKDDGGFLSTILGFFKGGIGGIIDTLVGALIKGGLIAAFLNALGKYFTDADFRKSVNDALDNFFKTVFGESYKKQILMGAGIFVGAMLLIRGSLKMFDMAVAAATRKLFGLASGSPGGGVPGGPGGPNGPNKKGGRARKFGGMLGKLGLYGMGAYGMYEGYDALFGGGQSDTSPEGSLSPNEEIVGGDKKSLGLNVDTALAAGGTALGVAGAVSGVSAIKKSLTPTAKAAAPAKPGFLMSAEDKIAERAARQAKAASKWGRFLAFLERKAPALFARLGVKLMAMAGLAAVPIAGWVAALVQLGFVGWDLYAIYQLWTEFTGTDEQEANPAVNAARIKASQDAASSSPTPTFDAMGNPSGFAETSGGAVTGRASSSSGGGGTSGGTSPSAISSDDSSRRQIEAYLGKAISDKEYDAFLRAVGAEAGPDPMERAAVGAVILNRAKKLGGDGPSIIRALNAPKQFQAITGPDGKSGTVDNPWSKNAKKLIPGIEKQIADNIALVPKGLDSFTSANEAAYKDVGGRNKFEQKMAEMSSLGGKRIGQTIFANGGVSVAQAGGTARTQVASAQADVRRMDNAIAAADKPLFSPDDLAAFAAAMRAPTMQNGGGGMTQVASVSKATPYEKDFYKGVLRTVAL